MSEQPAKSERWIVNVDLGGPADLSRATFWGVVATIFDVLTEHRLHPVSTETQGAPKQKMQIMFNGPKNATDAVAVIRRIHGIGRGRVQVDRPMRRGLDDADPDDAAAESVVQGD